MYLIPEITTTLDPLICRQGSLSNEEIESIIKIGDKLEFTAGKTGNNNLSPARKSKISFIRPTEETHWLFNKMSEIVAEINNDKFQFNLSHIDTMQYTTYIEGEFYNWHTDAYLNPIRYGSANHRKLGFSILLTDPETEFTGGEFQIIAHGDISHIDSIPMKKGDIIAFPSFIPHRVSEVTSGKRKSLVFWVLGSKFK